MAAYQLDLSRLSLDWLLGVLQTTRLLPSEAILAEQTERRLAALRDRGFGNLADLVSALATPRKVDALARETDLPARFLTVLRRTVGAGHGPSAGLLALSEEAGVDVEVLSRILGVCDFLRGPYVGPAFAELLWQAGFRELGDLRALAPDELHDRLVAANAASRCYGQAVPGGEDMRSWLVMVDEVVRGTA